MEILVSDWRPEQMPTLVMGRLTRLLARLNDEKLRPVGITAAQIPVVVLLKDGCRRTQKELAEISGVEQPSMAQLLARMERDHLIRREPDPKDKRSSLISLTDHARQKLEPGRDALREADDDACAGLTVAERETLTKLLEQVTANVAAAIV